MAKSVISISLSLSMMIDREPLTNEMCIRDSYKHSASSLPRIASFIGTSNREDLLVDRTGSRRFLCVSLKPVSYTHL